MGSCLCDKCAALCCRYIALPLDNPKSAEEYDNIRWYLLHENIVVFIEKKQWYLGIMARCKQLQPDNRCGIYDIRPRICRSYSTDNCDYHGGEYEWEILFTSADQLRDYAEKKLKKSLIPRPRKLLRKPQRAVKLRIRKGGNGQLTLSLPVLGSSSQNQQAPPARSRVAGAPQAALFARR